MRLNIHSSRFEGGDVNTRFQRRSEIAPDHVATMIDHTMQSNAGIDMTDDFVLNVIHVDIPLGHSLRRMRDVNMALNLVRRRCVLSGMKDWSIGDGTGDEIPCFAYALALGVRLLDHTYYQVRTWSRSRLQVRDAVLDYHARAGVPPGGVSPSHFQQFQDILPEGVRLVVVDAVQPKGLMFKGGSGDKIVAILYFNNHYFPMKNLHTWFGQGFYCVDCEVTAQKKTKHRCKKNFICPRCQSKRCLHLPKLHKYCFDCIRHVFQPRVLPRTQVEWCLCDIHYM